MSGGIISIKERRGESIIPEYMRASAIIPTLAFSEEDSLFLMDDQSLGFCFLCEPLCGGDEKVRDRVNGFLNQDFPGDTTLQIILFKSPDINERLHRMMGLRDGFRHDLLTPVIQERVRFLFEHTTEPIVAHTRMGMFNSGLVQDFKLIISCKIPTAGVHPSEKEYALARLLQTKVKSSLATIGLRPLPMDVTHYKRVMGTIFNWKQSASWRNDAIDWERDKPICEQILDYDTDIMVSRDGIQLGDRHVKVLSAKKMPDVFFFGDAMDYVGDLSGSNNSLGENYMVVTNLFFPDPEKTRNRMEKKRQFTINQAIGPMLKFVPVLGKKAEGFDSLVDSMQEGYKACQIMYSVVIFAPTKERAEAAAIAAQSIWRESRFEIMEDKFITWPLFRNCLPLCTDKDAVRDLYRYKTMTTEQAAVLIPIFGEWKGTGTHHAALLSRNGQLMSLSLHDSSTNQNFLIAAESGAGKSFLINELIFSYLSEGAQIWVIDAGKSYQKLCGLLEGDFVHFGEGPGQVLPCLNPFELIANYEEDEDSLVSLVAAMASPKGQLSEQQMASLKKIMSDLWAAKGKALQIDDIARECRESEDDRINDLGTQLYAFTSSGSYGKYFSGQNNVNFRSQFTVLELDELQGRKHLRQVVLLQLIYQIQQEVFLGERDRKKIVIIDEAWDLLKEGEVASFMEHAYRKFRKYRGSVGIATQSVNDLYENPVGRPIAENSANMFLLGQTQETVESIKRQGRLDLPGGGYDLLKSVHTIQGAYSEIFVKSNAGVGVGRLIVSDFQKLLYSTDPAEVHAIENYMHKGLSVPDAINAVLADRKHAA